MKTVEHNDTTVLITGGTRGIGRAISLGLAKDYAKTLILNYLQDDESAFGVREEINSIGAQCILVKANLNFPQDIDHIFEKVGSITNHLDSFIHCAALGAFKPTLKMRPNQWDLSMNINARSFLLCVQKIVPLMQKGSIVAISSLGSHKVVPNYGAIGPSKSALESLVRYLAVELAPQGIRINCVSGGFIETDSAKLVPDFAGLKENIRMHTPAGRIGKPEDIARVVAFLISPAAQWIYGQTIIADGGFSLV